MTLLQANISQHSNDSKQTQQEGTIESHAKAVNRSYDEWSEKDVIQKNITIFFLYLYNHTAELMLFYDCTQDYRGAYQNEETMGESSENRKAHIENSAAKQSASPEEHISKQHKTNDSLHIEGK